MSDPFLNAADADAIRVHVVARSGLGDLLQNLSAAQANYARATGFEAKAGATALLPGADGRIAAVLLGVGDADSGPARAMLTGVLATDLPAGSYRLVEPSDATLCAVAFGLGSYTFAAYRARRGDHPRLVMPSGADAAEVRRIVDGVALARDLINTPANDMGPAELADAAKALAAHHGATFSMTIGDELHRAHFPLIHAVGVAAAKGREPRLIDFHWGDPKHPKVTLVGKGVTFDTGGLDIKPSSSMLLMKKDMGGAANVLGLASMIMGATLPVRLRVLIPAVENAISGAAFRPGDIFKSRKGITVEIGNTDAEGRLILADALALASEDDPDLIFDLATLTGAARVALGPDIMPFYTGSDQLAAAVARHAEAAADPMWRMPLWAPYFKLFDSKVADLNNAGSSGFAGSITAALFLSRFVTDTSRWLHGDIFGWTPSAKPAKPEGGEAQTIRALYALLREKYGRQT